MKACVYKAARTIVIEDVPDPEPSPHEVVVKVKYTAICGSDLNAWRSGMLSPGVIMGHEVSGVVAQVGSAVSEWKEGDRVWVSSGNVCGRCTACLEGDFESCKNYTIVGFGEFMGLKAVQGGLAEYMTVPTSLLVPLPEGVGFKEATFVDPLGCGFHAAKRGGIQSGQSALVMGAGTIGLFLVLGLKSIGVSPVIVTEPLSRRAELARELGADHVFDPTKGNVHGALLELTAGVGPDVVFECVGIPTTILESVSFVRCKGQVVWVGMCMEEVPIVPGVWFFKQPSIHVSAGFGGQRAVGPYLEFIEDRKADVMKVVSEVISLDGVPDAFERLLNPHGEVKILVGFE